MSVTYARAHRLRLRLRHAIPAPASPRATAPVHVDPARRIAAAGGVELELTRLEFDLLARLVAHPLQVFSRDQLLEAVWQQPAVGDGRTVDVLMTRVRRKLGPRFRALLATVRGVGYKYDPGRVEAWR
ncbi:winged helix-turn-helix domain-containing protein [Streptacidiphilus sp. MAP12-20]|uniref:winged helix-turn-helix domain-containing protein n=1 Tax=Streptacidiphilus sp. MAP12-20 TaxID=3156299 RepID=UPI0035127E60